MSRYIDSVFYCEEHLPPNTEMYTLRPLPWDKCIICFRPARYFGPNKTKNLSWKMPLTKNKQFGKIVDNENPIISRP